MRTALDTTVDLTPYIGWLIDNSIRSVGRYYSTKPWKRLTRGEAEALTRAGITIFVVYQDRQNQLADFTATEGQRAATEALEYAVRVIGQPKGSAIYFAGFARYGEAWHAVLHRRRRWQRPRWPRDRSQRRSADDDRGQHEQRRQPGGHRRLQAHNAQDQDELAAWLRVVRLRETTVKAGASRKRRHRPPRRLASRNYFKRDDG